MALMIWVRGFLFNASWVAWRDFIGGILNIRMTTLASQQEDNCLEELGKRGFRKERRW